MHVAVAPSGYPCSRIASCQVYLIEKALALAWRASTGELLLLLTWDGWNLEVRTDVDDLRSVWRLPYILVWRASWSIMIKHILTGIIRPQRLNLIFLIQGKSVLHIVKLFWLLCAYVLHWASVIFTAATWTTSVVVFRDLYPGPLSGPFGAILLLLNLSYWYLRAVSPNRWVFPDSLWLDLFHFSLWRLRSGVVVRHKVVLKC